MKFEYAIVGQEVRIDRAEESEVLVAVPEELEGLPVTELGAYVLRGSCVEELHLPSRLRKIGAYGFYGCEKLKKLYCYGRVLDLGTGLFAAAGNVEFLDITLFDGERSCLKELLSELRQTLRVRIHLPDGSQARLIFPEYYEEAVENTPARILFIETHGCGHRYRYCFINREFQYRAYDEVFPHVQVQEPEALVTELALGRLLYPCGLSSRHEDMYREYVKDHWEMAGRLMVKAGKPGHGAITNLEPGLVPWLAEQFLEQEWQVLALARLAQMEGDVETVSWLMDFRHRKFVGQSDASAEQPDVRQRRKRRFEL